MGLGEGGTKTFEKKIRFCELLCPAAERASVCQEPVTLSRSVGLTRGDAGCASGLGIRYAVAAHRPPARDLVLPTCRIGAATPQLSARGTRCVLGGKWHTSIAPPYGWGPLGSRPGPPSLCTPGRSRPTRGASPCSQSTLSPGPGALPLGARSVCTKRGCTPSLPACRVSHRSNGVTAARSSAPHLTPLSSHRAQDPFYCRASCRLVVAPATL